MPAFRTPWCCLRCRKQIDACSYTPGIHPLCYPEEFKQAYIEGRIVG